MSYSASNRLSVKGAHDQGQGSSPQWSPTLSLQEPWTTNIVPRNTKARLIDDSSAAFAARSASDQPPARSPPSPEHHSPSAAPDSAFSDTDFYPKRAPQSSSSADLNSHYARSSVNAERTIWSDPVNDYSNGGQRGSMDAFRPPALSLDPKTYNNQYRSNGPPMHNSQGNRPPMHHAQSHVCKFFARSGSCSYGVACKFAHTRDEPSNRNVYMGSGGGGYGNNNGMHRRGPNSMPMAHNGPMHHQQQQHQQHQHQQQRRPVAAANRGRGYVLDEEPPRPTVPFGDFRQSNPAFVDPVLAELGLPAVPRATQVSGKIVALCKSYSGCGVVYHLLDSYHPAFCEQVLAELGDGVNSVCTDPWGNYVMQKWLDCATPEQRVRFVQAIQPDLVAIAYNSHGTRVVQKLIRAICHDDAATSLVIEAFSGGRIVELSKDINGNHVVQHCLSMSNNQFVYDAIIGDLPNVATHQHGCCVVQRSLKYATMAQREAMLQEVVKHSRLLCQDQYANYVVQNALAIGGSEVVDAMLQQLSGRFSELAVQKHSSNVVQRLIEQSASDATKLRIILDDLFHATKVARNLSDPFANYVMQTALPFLPREYRDRVKPALFRLGTSQSSRRIQSKIFMTHPDLAEEIQREFGPLPFDARRALNDRELQALTDGVGGMNVHESLRQNSYPSSNSPANAISFGYGDSNGVFTPPTYGELKFGMNAANPIITVNGNPTTFGAVGSAPMMSSSNAASGAPMHREFPSDHPANMYRQEFGRTQSNSSNGNSADYGDQQAMYPNQQGHGMRR